MTTPLSGGPRLATRTPHGNCAVEFQAGEACSKDNMFITNQSDFKTTVSALRRELKTAYPEASSHPSHAAMQELLAKALGASSYAELIAKLPKEPAAGKVKAPSEVKPRYPLQNLDGRFDLVEEGEEGEPRYGIDFSTIRGTSETIYACTADVSMASRLGAGNFDITYGGETDVNWNSQVSDKDDDGHVLWVNESGETVRSGAILLVPEDFKTWDMDLPLRRELVKEYDRYVRDNNLMDQLGADLLKKGYDCDTLATIAGVLGFALTQKELTWLQDSLKTADGLSD